MIMGLGGEEPKNTPLGGSKDRSQAPTFNNGKIKKKQAQSAQ